MNRQLFEDEGRKIRFNIYKEVIMKTNGDSVFLGHHSGDIIENVFTNMVRGLNYLHLGKMEKEMVNLYYIMKMVNYLLKEVIETEKKRVFGNISIRMVR